MWLDSGVCRGGTLPLFWRTDGNFRACPGSVPAPDADDEVNHVPRLRAALLALAYAVLAAHLLFIPYAYSPLGLAEAYARFADIAWDHLGADQNIALVSRALMFAPLGLLLAATVVPLRTPMRRRVAGLFMAGVLGCGIAVTINFAQVWFPARTINLNNVVAESFGVLAGALAWVAGAGPAAAWWRQVSHGGALGRHALLGGYVLAYLLASLAPFDFVTSGHELAQKLASGLYAPWMIAGGCGKVPCSLHLMIALAAAIPCGWWFAGRARGRSTTLARAVFFAISVSAAIEVLHLFMVSGVTQGGTLVFRATGLFVGAVAYPLRTRFASMDMDKFARPLVLLALVPYLAAVAYVDGWFRSDYLGFAGAAQRLASVAWMPFFYQYYAPYAETMQSTIVYAALFGCIGVFRWLWARDRAGMRLWSAAILAGLFAFVTETGKVLLSNRHPDYTDLLIAVVSASGTLALLRAVSRGLAHAGGDVATVFRGETDELTRGRIALRMGSPAEMAPRTALGLRAVGLLLLAIAAWTVLDFPLWRGAMALGLIAYGVMLVRLPLAYLVVVPALLPVFDLAPYTGRFFWDEFDVLMAVTIGVRFLLTPPAMRRSRRRDNGDGLVKAALTLLVTSLAASIVIGLWPLHHIGANAFSSYLSPYNALRVGKGYLWAGLLLWLLRHDAASAPGSARWLGAGLFCALVTTVASVFWEQFEFLGMGAAMLDPNFRASGMVSATHVGGAYLEALLVMLVPVGVAVVLGSERLVVRALAYVLVALDAIAVLLTISRAAFAGWVIAVATFALVWWRSRARRTGAAARGVNWAKGRHWAGLLALAGLGVVALLISQADALRTRLGHSEAGATERLAHWRESLNLMPFDPMHLLFGTGLGSFPRQFYLSYASEYGLPSYRVESAHGGEPGLLLLTGGDGMYVDQRVDARSGHRLTLSGMVRSRQTDATLGVSLCIKSMLNSVACDSAQVQAQPVWRSFKVQLQRPPWGGEAALAPVSLSLAVGKFGSSVEVTQLSLREDGRELLSNGSFRHGMDRWFFTSDDGAAWRASNTFLQIFLEQGMLGVLAWALLLVAALRRLVEPTRATRTFALAAGSIAGLLVTGTFDTLSDAPRLIVLLAMIVMLPAIDRDARQHATPSATHGIST